MNKTELLEALQATVPSLRGKLHIERVLYKKAANKAYISFLCDEPLWPQCASSLR